MVTSDSSHPIVGSDADIEPAAEGDRVEQTLETEALADAAPGPVADSVLDTANEADVAEQSVGVPFDDDDYR